MSTTAHLTTPTTVDTNVAARPTVWKHGVGAAVAAAGVTTVLAAIASAAGVSFADQSGQAIPLAGFTQLTFVFSMIGVGLAAIFARKARRPRRTFVRTTVALTAVSLVPDIAFDFDVASAISLMTLHVVAAAIAIPVLAKRLES